jgi:hypothetical protein
MKSCLTTLIPFISNGLLLETKACDPMVVGLKSVLESQTDCIVVLLLKKQIQLARILSDTTLLTDGSVQTFFLPCLESLDPPSTNRSHPFTRY